MPYFSLFFLLPTIASPDFDNFLIELPWQNLACSFLKTLPRAAFPETTKNNEFLGRFSQFMNPYVLMLFDYRCLRTSVYNSKHSISILKNTAWKKYYVKTFLRNCMQFVHIVSHTGVLNDVKFFGIIFVFEGLTCTCGDLKIKSFYACIFGDLFFHPVKQRNVGIALINTK